MYRSVPLIDTEKRLMAARGEGIWGTGEKDEEGIEKL